MYRSFGGCVDRVDRSITCIPPARRTSKVEPPLENLAPVRAQLVSTRAEFLDQLCQRTGAKHPFERLAVGWNVGPLLRNLGRYLEVELDAVSPRSPAEDLVWIEGRGRQELCPAREVECVGVPLEGEELAGSPAKSGSLTAASVRETGSSPTSGSAPG